MTETNHVVTKDGGVRLGRVDDAIRRIDAEERDQILRDFGAFKSYLHKRIDMAENIGLSEERMARIAEKVADYLAANEQPRNREEKLLQELWRVGREEERHMLAHMLLRMAQETEVH